MQVDKNFYFSKTSVAAGDRLACAGRWLTFDRQMCSEKEQALVAERRVWLCAAPRGSFPSGNSPRAEGK